MRTPPYGCDFFCFLFFVFVLLSFFFRFFLFCDSSFVRWSVGRSIVWGSVKLALLWCSLFFICYSITRSHVCLVVLSIGCSNWFMPVRRPSQSHVCLPHVPGMMIHVCAPPKSVPCVSTARTWYGIYPYPTLYRQCVLFDTWYAHFFLFLFVAVVAHRWQGISLGAVVALTLADHHDRDVGFTYNRKEAKDHGEKGHLVGADLKVDQGGSFSSSPRLLRTW